MRNRNTAEFLAVWEELHNPDFNRVQFEAIRMEKKQFRKKENIREYADLKYLLVLANMENYNAVMIEQGKSMSERLVILHDLAKK